MAIAVTDVDMKILYDRLRTRYDELKYRHELLVGLLNQVPQLRDAGDHGPGCVTRGHIDCLAHKALEILDGTDPSLPL